MKLLAILIRMIGWLFCSFFGKTRRTVVATLGLTLSIAQSGDAQTFRIERIASGLNQPTYVTQAPNDPANILYFAERTRDANPGFGASNVMGRVWRYDVTTR